MFRTLSNYYVYTDAFSRKICIENNVNWSSSFLYKCVFMNYPEITVSVTFMFLVSLSAYIVRILEVSVLYYDHLSDDG